MITGKAFFWSQYCGNWMTSTWLMATWLSSLKISLGFFLFWPCLPCFPTRSLDYVPNSFAVFSCSVPRLCPKLVCHVFLLRPSIMSQTVTMASIGRGQKTDWECNNVLVDRGWGSYSAGDDENLQDAEGRWKGWLGECLYWIWWHLPKVMSLWRKQSKHCQKIHTMAYREMGKVFELLV